MIRKAAVLCALLLLPASLHAQQGGGMGRGGMGMGGGGMMGMMENVPEFVATKAADLALSAEQVASLEAIAKKLTEKNEPIMAQLRDAMQGGMPAQADRQRLMDSRDTLMKNSEAAQKELEAVLTAEQLARANVMIEEWRRSRPQMRRGGGQ
jgi:hypothetical protein